jgi:hypothetical protein
MTCPPSDLTLYQDDIALAIERVYPRYRQFVERQDLIQELYLWIAGHADTADTLRRQSRYYLLRRLRTVADRYGRKQKAISAGYHPDDEWFYTLPEIERLLPDAFNPHATPPQKPVDETTGAGGGVVDLADWSAGVVDVRRALKQIKYPHYAVLKAYVAGNKVNPDELRRGFVALQRRLGGTKPRG